MKKCAFKLVSWFYSKIFINFLDCYFLIFRLQFLLIERVKIEVTLMLLRVSVLRTEYILATALHTKKANFLFA